MEADADLDCRRASKLLSLAGERPLSAEEAAALRRHIEECFMCANFEEQLRFLREAAKRYRAGS